MNAPDRPDKFRRHRARKRERGLKQVRLWLPDTSTSAFEAEAARQAALLRGAAEEDDILAFMEAVGADLEAMIDEEERRGGTAT